MLLAHSPTEVEAAIRKYLRDTDHGPPWKPIPSNLLAQATASAPSKLLSRQEADTLRSIFGSVKELEAGTRTPEGQVVIKDLFTPATARDIIDFWEDEYLAA